MTMVDTNPVGTERLRAYWVSGPGAARIRWGVSGDYDRCIRLVQEAVTKGGEKPLGDHIIHGLCATMHKLATGATPGHAPGEQGHG